jgi:YHS domain-containing protein
MKPTRRLFLALALLFALAPRGLAEDPPQEKRRDVSHFNLGKDGLALEGYDPVAYFEEGGGKPRKGSKEFELRHRGVLYRFSSAKHKRLFEARPARFEPAYGGWCAYAMAKGDKVEVDPKSFLVTDGELTLFYKGLFNDTRKKWLKQPAELKKKADAAWKKILEKRGDRDAAATPAPAAP